MHTLLGLLKKLPSLIICVHHQSLLLAESREGFVFFLMTAVHRLTKLTLLGRMLIERVGGSAAVICIALSCA